LTEADMKKLTELSHNGTNINNQAEFDEEKSFSLFDPLNGEYGEGIFIDGVIGLFSDRINGYANTTDNLGNIRVLRVY